MPAIVNGTDGITFPSWTTPTRPAVPVAGQAGFNTTIGAMETYTGSAWSTSDLPATGASGNFLQSNGTSWTSASTLAVSNGGTGQTTLTTAYGVLAAGTTATGALQNIGTGTSTQVLTSNGPGVLPSFQAAAAGGFSNMTVYTGPGTFTTPASTTRIKVTVVGGGNSGGAGSGAGPTGRLNGGGGGGGGGAAIYVGPVTASTPYAVTVGAAGGNTSSFGALASATGGAAGTAATTGSGGGLGGAGGAGSAGTLQIKGDSGQSGSGTQTNFANMAGGNGGTSIYGGGGTGGAPGSSSGTPGGNYGGGGGGGGGYNVPGSPGAAGVVVVEF
jgi:hypothetical protein